MKNIEKEFIDFYAPVDNPKALLLKVKPAKRHGKANNKGKN